jgi:HEPN domain-containing protein
MAEKDCCALHGMQDAEVFSEEIFGFHVQQAVEKTLKAWLCCLGIAFPRTHDLDELGMLLENANHRIPEPLVTLLEFTDFAVAFRYEAFPELEADIHRRDCVEQVERLLQHVRGVLRQMQS